MNDNVVLLDVETTLDVPPDRILKYAMGRLSRVIVFGDDLEGNTYIACSFSSLPEMLWLAERCKRRILEETDDA